MQTSNYFVDIYAISAALAVHPRSITRWGILEKLLSYARDFQGLNETRSTRKLYRLSDVNELITRFYHCGDKDTLIDISEDHFLKDPDAAKLLGVGKPYYVYKRSVAEAPLCPYLQISKCVRTRMADIEKIMSRCYCSLMPLKSPYASESRACRFCKASKGEDVISYSNIKYSCL